MKKRKHKKAQDALSRRNFLSKTGAGIGGLALTPLALDATSSSELKPKEKPHPLAGVEAEWRNRNEEMSYRMLGRTGMMISEVVSGGDPVRSDNYQQVHYALEKGLNYLDMAPAYGKGDCETAYSKVIDSSSMRAKVFMTTKVSGFTDVRSSLYQDIFKGLPSEKQNAILKRANEIRAERGIDKPGYFIRYWPGQKRSNDPSYLANAMVKDYGHKVDGSKAFRKKIKDSLEGSLSRAKTDYFDILMCPHGANCPEEVQIPEIYETFKELKKEGKVRFLGVSTHNDPAGVLRAATATGEYDVVMCAYNIANGGYLEAAIANAYQNGLGIIAMKAAMAVATHHKAIQPIPQWRIDKVNRIIPGDLKAPMKAYVWALQNPHISAVISNLWDKQFIDENLSLAGMKVELADG
jgi:aryl-alcohol dehydrogenase-like predicted oxidoreductase